MAALSLHGNDVEYVAMVQGTPRSPGHCESMHYQDTLACPNKRGHIGEGCAVQGLCRIFVKAKSMQEALEDQLEESCCKEYAKPVAVACGGGHCGGGPGDHCYFQCQKDVLIEMLLCCAGSSA